MPRYNAYSFLPAILIVLVAGCTERAPATNVQAEVSCDDSGVRAVVERLGERMKDVPLLAPDSILVGEIRDAYTELVTPDLLESWISEPSRAPGREVSSPWPDRIEVRSLESAGAGACRVEGEVVYMTSTEVSQGGAVSREPVTVSVEQDGAWLVSAFEKASPSPADPTAVPSPTDSIPTSAEAAADVIRRYYEAIDARDYRRAYEHWGDSGRSSGQTFEEFAAGFSETSSVEAEVGMPGRIDPAAGSRYVEVPVLIRAEAKGGEEQRFEGTYTLRRSEVDGATEAQRRWHIYSADISRVQ